MTGWRQHALTVLVLLSASVVFSWPTAIQPLDLVLTRQFDAWSLLWLLGEAPHLGLDLFTERAAWPLGQTLRRSDSALMLPLGAALSPFIGPAGVMAGLVVLGPVVSGWAAERFAAGVFGAAWPWSIIAGLAWGFCGLSATAVLEGHAYFLLSPWLPLLGLYGWRTIVDKRAKDGVIAGAMWALCLLSTAYLGIVATALVLAGLVAAWRRGALRSRGALGAAAVALPVGLAYLGSFLAAGGVGGGVAHDSPGAVLVAGSATLSSLAGWTPSMDAAGHSIAPWLPHVALVLALSAPLLLPRRRWPLGWAAVAAVGVALSLGPRVLLGSGGVGVPWLMAPLAWVDGEVWFHFPARLVWLAVLPIAGVAALVASRLAGRARRPVHRALVGGLLALCWLDAAVFPALAWRGDRVPLAVPSAYDEAPADLAILELVPGHVGPNWDLALKINNLLCAYQRVHQRPLANLCVGIDLEQAPRRGIADWLRGRVLAEGGPEDVVQGLGEMGFGAVAFHPDWFPEPDRSALAAGLRGALGPPVAVSRDAGDFVELYGVDGGVRGARADHVGAWRRWVPSAGAGSVP